MLNHKISFFLFLFFLGSGCQKTNEQIDDKINVYNKVFTPPGNQEGVSMILMFIKKTSHSISERNQENTEINEAKWLLEASANYMWNQNLFDRSFVGIVEMPLVVENISEGGVLKMVGNSMIHAFNTMNSNLANEIGSSSQTIACVDIVFDSISQSSSFLKVKAILTESEGFICPNANNNPNVDPSSNIGYINGTTEYCVNNYLLNASLSPGCFFADVYIVSYVGEWQFPNGEGPDIVKGQTGLPCTLYPQSPPPLYQCLHGDETEFVWAFPTAAQFCGNQADITMAILNDIEIDVFGPPPAPPAQRAQTITKLSTDLQVIHTVTPIHPPHIIHNWYQICVANMLFGIGPVYCL